MPESVNSYANKLARNLTYDDLSLGELKQSFPVNIQKAVGNINVIYEGGPNYAETYPVGETGAPDFFGRTKFPGGAKRPTIAIRPKGRQMTMDQQKTMLVGETLHFLHNYIPEFKTLRNDFDKETLNDPQQMRLLQSFFDRDVKGGEDREFPQWYDVAGRDMLLRGRLTPDPNDEWSRYPYSKKQDKILSKMKRIIGD